MTFYDTIIFYFINKIQILSSMVINNHIDGYQNVRGISIMGYSGTFSSLKRLFIGCRHPSDENWDEDAKLVREVKRGNRDSYATLFDKYHEKIYGQCFRIFFGRKDPEKDAQDATQEAFTRCFECIYSLKNDRCFFQFLRCTARRISLDMIRGSRTIDVDGVKESLIPGGQGVKYRLDPGEKALKGEHTRIVLDALDTLRENYRLAVICVHLEGCSYAEAAQIIAQDLNRSVTGNDIKKWVHRGLKQLRKRLKDCEGLIE